MNSPKTAAFEGKRPELDDGLRSSDVPAELARRERLLRAAFDGALDAIVLTDDEGSCVMANPAASALFGREPAVILGRTLEQLGASPALRLPTGEASTPSGQRRGHAYWLRADGGRLEVEYGATANVLPGMHLWVLRDVTEQRRAEASLLGSERKYRQIVDTAREGIWHIDEHSKTTFVNGALANMLGYSTEEMVGKSLFDFMDEEGREIATNNVARRRGGISETHEFKLLKKDGSCLWTIMHATPIFEAGKYVGALAMVTDDTARRRAAEALRASEEQYRLLFECSPLPKWLTDGATTRFLAVNAAACQLWGYSKEELLQLTSADVLTAEALVSVREAVATTPPSQPICGTWRNRRKDGALIDVDVHALTFNLEGRDVRLVVGQDVTHRHRLEAQLVQAQKMEAVGLLAGGIAHDFNNLLSVVATYGSFMLDALKPGDPLRDDVSEIAKASARAMALTSQLLAFSRQQILEPRIMDLNATVSGIQNMLQRLLGDGIELSFAGDRGLGRVHADPGQIEQVIMNLVVNARDAMPDGGTLTIETKNVRLDAEYAAQHPGVAPGSYVMLSMTDTGVGMDAQTRERIFEPFFTTKELGKGTGLGLPTVLGITQQSGGNLAVFSEPGRGTTFKIHLPRVDGVVVQSESLEPPTVTSRGNETILVVDDDDQVRQLVRAILRRKGYRVIDARNGGEAFLICEQQTERIDLLLTDMVMPKMNGPQLAERLLPMRPGMKVLFMSGCTPDRYVRDADVVVLPKPITPDTLSRKVREVLGEGRAESSPLVTRAAPLVPRT